MPARWVPGVRKANYNFPCFGRTVAVEYEKDVGWFQLNKERRGNGNDSDGELLLSLQLLLFNYFPW